MEPLLILFISLATAALSLLVKLIGFPDQIKKIHQRKSVEGISRWFFILSFISYLLWTIHGVIQNDWVVYIGQGLGVLTTGTILFQFWLYKNKKIQ